MNKKELEYEQTIEKHIKLLGCTREEAIDIIETDKIIDKGGRTQYDLSKEEEKLAMKISGVNERRAKSTDNKRGKVRAENPTKADLIKFLFESLTEYDCQNLNILNKERQIAFSVGDNDYELTLVQKRKKK
jgi:hypothetical protein